ncbi:MAG: TadE family protein [Bryobacteraceae bacterium]
MTREKGQGLVEATFVMLAFFALLLGVIDCAQVLFAHQALVERVRSSVRWGVVHPWQGPEQITNLILYEQTTEPRAATAGYLGLKRENVVVRHQPPTADRPDDETLTVEIVNFESHFFSPVIGKTLVNPRPVRISAPVSFK